jgi:hypothetical protein
VVVALKIQMEVILYFQQLHLLLAVEVVALVLEVMEAPVEVVLVI